MFSTVRLRLSDQAHASEVGAGFSQLRDIDLDDAKPRALGEHYVQSQRVANGSFGSKADVSLLCPQSMESRH